MTPFFKSRASYKRVGWRIAGVLLASYVAIVGLLMLFEEQFIFFPAKYPQGDWDIRPAPAAEGQIVPQITDCNFTARDGVALHGWYCTPQQNRGGTLVPVPAPMVLLWFHGNAGNITHRYEMIQMMMALPVSVLIVDYRGYGKSGGHPSEPGLYEDARAAWEYLQAQYRVPTERIIIFGKSLGGAPAIDLAAKVQPAGLIVQSTFTSIADMAAAVMPFLPRFWLRTKMDSMGKIPQVRSPKLFIHSPADEVIPYALGRRLFEAAAPPKQFYAVPDAPHNETYRIGGAAYFEALRGFVRACTPPGTPK